MPDGPEIDATGNSGGAEEPPLEPTGDVIPPKRDPLANLKPFQKGQSGNPKGKAKGAGALGIALSQMGPKKVPQGLLSKIPDDAFKLIGKRPTMAQLGAFRLYQLFISGDMGAARLIFERTEGRVPVTPPMVEDDGQLDRLMEVLRLGPVAPGEVNE